jgi:DNA repair ATPase RecN
MRKGLASLLVGILTAAALLAADASDAARAELLRERRRLSADSKTLTDVSRRLETALNQLASASRAVADAASRTDSGPDEIARREDAVSDAEQEVRTLLEKRRLPADRIVERRAPQPRQFELAVAYFQKARQTDANHWQSLLNWLLVEAYDRRGTRSPRSVSTTR